MVKNLFWALALIILGSVATVQAADLKLGGGAPPVEKTIMPVKAAFQQSTGIILDIKTYGPKFALIDLARNEVSGAVLFLKPDEVAGMIKKEGIKLDPASLQQVEVGKDVVKVIVHKDNPVKSLTKEQAKGIFTGKITNWQEVGGKDAPIIVVYSEIIKGVNDLFAKHILGGAPFTKEVLDTTSAKEVRNAVATNPEAIGLSAISMVDSTVTGLESPEIAVPVIIYSIGKPNDSLQKLIDFIVQKK